jgi:hypothetical protein
VLSTGFSLPQVGAPGQFHLFPTLGVAADGDVVRKTKAG